MSIIKKFREHSPKIHETAFIAETAVVIGEVEIAEGASVWYGAVLRGDIDLIKIGKNSNVQDGAVLHCSTGIGPTIVGEGVTIGHRAIVHGAHVGDNCLIGMSSTVMDEAVIEPNTVVAAGAVVLAKAHLESGWIYAGIPAKKVKKLSPEQIEGMKEAAHHYVETGEWYRENA